MRPSRIHATTALGLIAAALLWTSTVSPAAASEDASWREAGHFDTTGACQRAGKNGIQRHKWDEYKCRPGRNDSYVTLWVRGGSRSRGHRAPADGPVAA
ncbi:hypothetical protein [Streptomyces sp. NPDC005322]|uniref:hypothetical protein n=1 Tax=unclassified Streptomyces TaxID=2593676 RepID=UPI0033BF4DC0